MRDAVYKTGMLLLVYAFCCGTCAMAQQSNQLMTHEGFVMDGPQKVKKAEPPKLTEMPRA